MRYETDDDLYRCYLLFGVWLSWCRWTLDTHELKTVYWTPQFCFRINAYLCSIFGCNEMHSSKWIRQKWQRHIHILTTLRGNFMVAWLELVVYCGFKTVDDDSVYGSIWLLVLLCIFVVVLLRLRFHLLRGRRKKKAQKDSIQSLRERWSHIPECVINGDLVLSCIIFCGMDLSRHLFVCYILGYRTVSMFKWNQSASWCN